MPTPDAPASSTALLVMDVQRGIVDRYVDAGSDLLPTLERAVDKARDAGVMVVFVVVRFRRGYPEVSPRNRAFARIVARGGDAAAMTEADPSTEPVIAPREGEPVVAKKRVSAFAGSDLAMILRARGITRLVLAGIATSGVVLSTLRRAADLDFELTVLSDGCADRDPEVHRVLLEKVFPRQAEVVTVTGWEPRGPTGRP